MKSFISQLVGLLTVAALGLWAASAFAYNGHAPRYAQTGYAPSGGRPGFVRPPAVEDSSFDSGDEDFAHLVAILGPERLKGLDLMVSRFVHPTQAFAGRIRISGNSDLVAG